jgi:hypothetical protein
MIIDSNCPTDQVAPAPSAALDVGAFHYGAD